jgi:hypothetical protein
MAETIKERATDRMTKKRIVKLQKSVERCEEGKGRERCETDHDSCAFMNAMEVSATAFTG